MANSMLQDYSNYGDTDRQDRTADRTLEVTMPTLTESVTLAADGWSTYCSNRTLDLSKTDGITGYIVTSTSANKAVITPVTVVPAGTGFILNGTGASPYELYATAAAANDVSGNELIGTLSATAAPANTFVLSTKSDKTGFYPVQSGLTIPAHKAYLVLTGSGARELVINGESTGMNSIKANPADAVIYTVQGTVASEHSKGVVVKNSKLHISK